MALATADALIAPITGIDGFLQACLVDATTGMVLASTQRTAGQTQSVAAAAAADLAGVLTMMADGLAYQDELEDVMVTFGAHLHLVRLVPASTGHRLLLLVILDRARTNLGMARHEVRNYCAGLAG